MSEITWRLLTDDAARLARLLGEVIDVECLDEGDLDEVERYVDELLGLIKQQRDYEATIQPGLIGLA